jgi:hypothetical protein
VSFLHGLLVLLNRRIFSSRYANDDAHDDAWHATNDATHEHVSSPPSWYEPCCAASSVSSFTGRGKLSIFCSMQFINYFTLQKPKEVRPPPPLPDDNSSESSSSNLMQRLQNLMDQYNSTPNSSAAAFSVPPPLAFDPSQPPPPIMPSVQPPPPMANASPMDAPSTPKESKESPRAGSSVKPKTGINIVLGNLKSSSIQQRIQEAEQMREKSHKSPLPSGSDIEMSMSDQEEGQIIEFQPLPKNPPPLVMPDMSLPPPNMADFSAPPNQFNRFSERNSASKGALEDFREGANNRFNQGRNFNRHNDSSFGGFGHGNNSSRNFQFGNKGEEKESGFHRGDGGGIPSLMSVNPRLNRGADDFQQSEDYTGDYESDHPHHRGFGRGRDDFQGRGNRRDWSRHEDRSRGDQSRDNRYDDHRGGNRHGRRWNDDDRRGERRGRFDRWGDLPFETDNQERMLAPRYNTPAEDSIEPAGQLQNSESSTHKKEQHEEQQQLPKHDSMQEVNEPANESAVDCQDASLPELDPNTQRESLVNEAPGPVSAPAESQENAPEPAMSEPPSAPELQEQFESQQPECLDLPPPPAPEPSPPVPEPSQSVSGVPEDVVPSGEMAPSDPQPEESAEAS